MSTTDHTVTTINGTDEERRMRQLQQLLLRRERLAAVAAERQSHELPGADDFLYEVLTVEQAIGHCWPAVYEEMFAEWALRDYVMLHSPKQPRADCGICQASARSTGPRAA